MIIKNVTPIASSSFVGVKIQKNNIEFYYPESYALKVKGSNQIDSHDVITLLRTLSLSNKMSNNLNELNNKNKDKFDYPLNSYIWLINDYLENKRYDNREKVLKHGQQGKINWNKTLHQNPMICDGNFIYNDLISERKSQIDNLITQIYLFCVNSSVRDAGWIFNLPYNEYEFGKMYVDESKKRIFVSVIKNEMAHTFDDCKRVRLSHMLNVLKGLDTNLIGLKNYVKGVDRYDYVFESMVDEMFSSVENKKDFFPDARWDLLCFGTKNTNKLRPDTLIVNNQDKKIYILDSKNYRYGYTFDPYDLPNVSSIEKQITYGEFALKLMRNKGEVYEVYNSFVIPYSKQVNQTDYAKAISALIRYDVTNTALDSNLVFVGTAFAMWNSDVDSKHRKIATILIDLNFLISNWNRRQKDNIDEIVKLIERKIDN